MTTFAVRKRAELFAKLGAIKAELTYWGELSAAKGPLEKHHTQVRAVSDRLSPLISRVGADIDVADVEESWARLETQVLDLHRIWGYFRDKFIQRQIAEFSRYLALADEFAWACYDPAQKAAIAAGTVEPPDVREPPLTFLTNSDSPFSVSRQTTYQWAQGPDAPMSREARKVTNRLPLPVIGLPWFQLRHLPEALVIGHEVGHVVHRELIGADLPSELVKAALPSPLWSDPDRATWAGWANEAFADAYGALCGGPSYRSVLSDFLGAEHPVADRTDAAHPPPDVRIRLVDAVLTAPSGQGEPPSRDGDPTGAVAVARALVAGPYPRLTKNGRLDAVIGCAEQRDLGHQPKDLLNGFKPETRDIRTLLAVAARAFLDDPERYAQTGVAERVLDRARSIQQPGTRAGREVDHAADPTPAEIDALYALLATSPDTDDEP